MADVRDHDAWARALGISREAIDVYASSEIIDLHIDSFIWTRVLGYDLTRRHRGGLFGTRLYGQVDIPRIREARIGGGIWVVTTNPTRGSGSRVATFQANLARLKGIFESVPDDVALVKTASDYARARSEGKHAAFLGIQGGNAVDTDVDVLTDDVVRVTLVHLSNSDLGRTSAPGGGDDGLSSRGKDFVRALDAKDIFVDLAHVNRRGFFDALDVHDRTKPAIVTHTGISAVHRHWRNIDDDQIRAIADTGGTIGIMYHTPFTEGAYFGGRAERIVDHIAHVVTTVGDDFVSLGSDWDGAILTPRDMKTCLELPRLVELMLRRGFDAERIRKILGGNWLRTLALLRP